MCVEINKLEMNSSWFLCCCDCLKDLRTPIVDSCYLDCTYMKVTAVTAQQIGYKRVSTYNQNTDRQLDGVDIDKVFEDKVSGSSTDRPQLTAMLAHIREGDVIHVHSIDRLARNLGDLMSLIEKITSKGTTVKFHKESLTFTGEEDAMQKLMLQLMGAVAQFERSMINERAAEGRAIAKAKGKRFGRKPALQGKQVSELKRMYDEGVGVSRLAIDFDVSRQAVYRALQRPTI